MLPGRRWFAHDTAGQSPRTPANTWARFTSPSAARNRLKWSSDRAVALLHHMTYPQARQGFERVATHRSAMRDGVLGSCDDPVPAALAYAAATRSAAARVGRAVVKAKTLAPPTERERLFVAAAEAFFLEPAATDYWLRIARWERAMEKVYSSFPDDPEAASFYALALLATAPRIRVLARMPTKPPKFCSVSTRRIRTTRVPCTTWFTPTTSRDANGNRWRSQRSTKPQHPAIHTRSICRRISTPASATGTA